MKFPLMKNNINRQDLDLVIDYLKNEDPKLTPTFIEKLLKYDHNERMTAKEAMTHKWFDTIPNRNLSERGL